MTTTGHQGANEVIQLHHPTIMGYAEIHLSFAILMSDTTSQHTQNRVLEQRERPPGDIYHSDAIYGPGCTVSTSDGVMAIFPLSTPGDLVTTSPATLRAGPGPPLFPASSALWKSLSLTLGS